MDILEIMNTPYYKEGNTIHIKKENRGKFTRSAKEHNMGVQEFATHVLNNKDKYSPTLVKRANFAHNSKKFKHAKGGQLVYKFQNSGIIDRLTNSAKRQLLNFKNQFVSEKSHLSYTPDMNEGDSYNNSIIIDKGRQHMYAYDKNGNLVFYTPVSTGANLGNKSKENDSKTPVGKFAISKFESNRDPKIFGAPEFWRLRGTGFIGIGIHGDAGHPEQIGQPASHGCVRIPCDSIQSFQKKVKPYAGQTVYILDEFGNYE